MPYWARSVRTWGLFARAEHPESHRTRRRRGERRRNESRNALARERVVWYPAFSIPAKEFGFTDPEVARIKAALRRGTHTEELLTLLAGTATKTAIFRLGSRMLSHFSPAPG